MDLKGSGTRMSEALWRPVAACAAGLDPPNIKISDSGGLDLEAWMPGCWKDWNGLEEVTEVMEGIGRGAGDCKKFPHARASGARRTCISGFVICHGALCKIGGRILSPGRRMLGLIGSRSC